MNLDGFTRIKKECNALKLLNSKKYTVDFYDYFEIWENNYLIEEYLEGINLKEFVSQNFPFSVKENRNIYKNKMIKVLNQLIDSLSDLHDNDIALGDLQPNNVIILENGDIKLIDLESATSPKKEYRPGLMTPGYVTKKAKTFEQADWFALLRIARFLFLPIENLSDLSVSIEHQQNQWIENYFGKDVVQCISVIESKVLQTLNILKQTLPLKSSEIEISANNKSNIINSLRESIINNLDIETSQLINGDIRQYTDQLGALNISNGGFGAIMALHRTGELPKKVNNWIEDVFFKIFENKLEDYNIPIGLFNGISGIASVLYDIGYKEKSIDILKSIILPEKHNGENLTLSCGLAGMGLNFIAFYSIEKEKVFLDKAIHIYRLIKSAFSEKETLITNDTDSLPYGLLNGWSGISLFILYMSEYLDDIEKTESYKLSIEMLDYEIDKNTSVNEELGLAQIQEYSLGHKRLIPYLGEGAAGLALIIIEFNKKNPYFMKCEYDDLLIKLSNITDLYSTYTSGLFRGIGGMIVLSNVKNKMFGDRYSLSHTIKSLGNYLLYNNEVGLVSPGEYGYRLSMDLQTGSSGLLLSLIDIDRDGWESWMPLPSSNKLGLFKIK